MSQQNNDKTDLLTDDGQDSSGADIPNANYHHQLAPPELTLTPPAALPLSFSNPSYPAFSTTFLPETGYAVPTTAAAPSPGLNRIPVCTIPVSQNSNRATRTNYRCIRLIVTAVVVVAASIAAAVVIVTHSNGSHSGSHSSSGSTNTPSSSRSGCDTQVTQRTKDTKVYNALSCDFAPTRSYNYYDYDGLSDDDSFCNYEQYVSISTSKASDKYKWSTTNGNYYPYNPSANPCGSKNDEYAYISSSNGKSGDFAYLVSKPVKIVKKNTCLKFWYHMSGMHVGRLSVNLLTNSTYLEQNSSIWNRTHQQGNVWRLAAVRLPVGRYNVSFIATRGITNSDSHIAMDKIEVTEDKVCADNPDCKYPDYRCGSGECITNSLKCDFVTNCRDGSDEAQCSSCPDGQEKCANENKCIMPEWFCDRERDCADGSDEKNCDTHQCSLTDFTCQDNSCVLRTKRCDGISQCTDGSDEIGCAKYMDQNRTYRNYSISVNKNGNWFSVCSDNWSDFYSNMFCQAIGMGSVEKTYSYDVLSSQHEYLQMTTASSLNLQRAHRIRRCQTGRIVGVQCKIHDFPCGTRSPDIQFSSSYIFSGHDAQLGSWPWQVYMDIGGKEYCGGSIINENWVLTAGHCTEEVESAELGFKTKINPSEVTLTVGGTHRDGSDVSAQKVYVDEVHQQPLFKDLIDDSEFKVVNDVALLHLKTPLVFNDYIRPVCMPTQNQRWPLSSLCYVSGYGKIDELGTAPLTLQEAKMRLVSQSKCRDFASKLNDFDVDDSQFCAGYDTSVIGTCQGDSGGPLVCLDPQNRWTLVGSTSWGSATCSLSQYSVFANTSHFADWITEKITNHIMSRWFN